MNKVFQLLEAMGWRAENENWYDEEGVEGTRITSPEGKEFLINGWNNEFDFEEFLKKLNEDNYKKFPDNFHLAVLNLSKFRKICEVNFLVDTSSFNVNRTMMYDNIPFYDFDIEIDKVIKAKLSIPAIEEFDEYTIIYFNDSKCSINLAKLTKKKVLCMVKQKLDKLEEEKKEISGVLLKYN